MRLSVGSDSFEASAHSFWGAMVSLVPQLNLYIRSGFLTYVNYHVTLA